MEDQLYVCGGCDGNHMLNSVDRYDPAQGEWQRLPPMSHRRSGAGAVVLHGRMYVCGGEDGQGTLNSVERFNPTSHEWETLPPMCRRRCLAAVAVVSTVRQQTVTW